MTEGKIVARIIDPTERKPETWEEAESALNALKDEATTSIDIADGVWMIVLCNKALGYFVHATDDERVYFVTIDRSLGDEPVEAFDGGNTNIYPRYVFVAHSHMLDVAKTFYNTAQKDDRYEWVDDSEAMYD